MRISARVAIGSAVALVVITAAHTPSRVSRTALRTLERSTDTSFETMMQEERLSVLGYTRSVYLDGFGVVFSTEVELVPSAAPNPFRPQFTKEDVARLREKKRVRISYLKEQMPAMLVNLAHSLREVPPNDKVALAVTIPYFRWENADGMPRQIVMTAPRRALLLSNGSELAKAIRTEEYF
ncbi:MAG TPA: hypothetical protein VES20_22045 [Bryobacteraceae bacterium]|nr:hypothetical protein [Bryobacteraceae bacterium]